MSHSDDIEEDGKDERTNDPGAAESAGAGREDGTSPLLGRRTALKAGAAALASAVGVGTAAAQENYDTVTVPSGTIKRINVGGGETLRNKLFDVSAAGAGVKIVTSGSGWVVENIGFKGRFNAKTFAVIPHVDGGGRGVIRNVYAKGYGTSGGGVWIQPSHAGELLIENVWLEGFPNNGVYGSAPGKRSSGGKGRVVIRDSVGCNNNVAQFRTGSPNCVVENCAMWLDQIPEDYPLTNTGVTARGVWVRGYDCTVRDCDVQIPTSYDEAGAAILAVENPNQFPGSDRTYADLENTCVQGFTKGDIVGSSAGEPEKRIPAGVPRTPEEAASGGGAGTGNSDTSDTSQDRKQLHIEGTGDRSVYTFSVSGELETTDTVDAHENVNGSSVTGVLYGGVDEFRFTGELVDFTVYGDASATVDGQSVSPASPDGDWQHLRVVGNGDYTAYDVAVSGDLRTTETVNPHDDVSDASVSGVVIGGADDYLFTGELESLQTDGDIAVLVDGAPVDDTSAAAAEPTWHDLQVAGTGERTIYAFEVSGELETTDTVDPHENVHDSAASGVVYGGIDDFRFTGELVDFTAFGDLELSVDGQSVDPSSL